MNTTISPIKKFLWQIEFPKPFRGNDRAQELFLNNLEKNPLVTSEPGITGAIHLTNNLSGREFREHVLLPVIAQTRQDLAKETAAAP